MREAVGEVGERDGVGDKEEICGGGEKDAGLCGE